jgi:hypothetical protein
MAAGNGRHRDDAEAVEHGQGDGLAALSGQPLEVEQRDGVEAESREVGPPELETANAELVQSGTRVLSDEAADLERLEQVVGAAGVQPETLGDVGDADRALLVGEDAEDAVDRLDRAVAAGAAEVGSAWLGALDILTHALSPGSLRAVRSAKRGFEQPGRVGGGAPELALVFCSLIIPVTRATVNSCEPAPMRSGPARWRRSCRRQAGTPILSQP